MNKLLRNKGGFTLTEVLIGMMLLTIAVVAATSMLTGLIGINRNNVMTLKAYYLAQEGIEGIRNIRDTNWLHNSDFMEGSGVYGEGLVVGNRYALGLDTAAFGVMPAEEDDDAGVGGLSMYRGWVLEKTGQIQAGDMGFDPYDLAYALVKADSPDGIYVSSSFDDDKDVYYRHIDILDACEEGGGSAILKDECGDYFLVRSVVNWYDGGRQREMVLEAVLSDWKGGAL